MSTEMLMRAKKMACNLTDPTTKKDSFYCIVRHKAKAYGLEKGINLEIRKCSLSPWVTEYLYSVFVQDLPIKEEKSLIGTLRIVSYIMEHRIPGFVDELIAKQHTCDKDCRCSPRPFLVVNGKVPRRGGFGE